MSSIISKSAVPHYKLSREKKTHLVIMFFLVPGEWLSSVRNSSVMSGNEQNRSSSGPQGLFNYERWTSTMQSNVRLMWSVS